LIYYHYLLSRKDRVSLRTKDIDIIVPEKLEMRGIRSVDKILQESGFEVRYKSRNRVPAVSYEGKIGGFDVEIEFLTHLKGSGNERVIKVQPDLHAQSLRYISVLLENAIEVTIDDCLVGKKSVMKIRVPSPGAYVFQKGLTFSRRINEIKKSKDLYYIFDVISQDPEWTKSIRDEISGFKSKYPLKWTRRFVKNLRDNFQDVNSKGVSRVLSQRPGDAFPDLNDDQFKQYVLGIFRDFIEKVGS